MPSYIDQNGELKNFQISQLEFLKILNITITDNCDILNMFYQWAGYFPNQSNRPETDFDHFIRYCLKDEDLKLKAAAILNLHMEVLKG